MNQLSSQGQSQVQQGSEEGRPQPGLIQVNVKVILQGGTIQFQINIDPQIRFTEFVEGVKEQIFAQRISDQYDEKIEYSLGSQNIQGDEKRTMKELGFTYACTLSVRLILKGGN